MVVAIVVPSPDEEPLEVPRLRADHSTWFSGETTASRSACTREPLEIGA
jgi:hypothetical protein